MNKTIQIVGGNRLHGEYHVQGAKNEALMILGIASFMRKRRITFTNVPDIEDVRLLIEIMADCGTIVEADWQKHVITMHTPNFVYDPEKVQPKMGRLRGSLNLIPGILYGAGECHMFKPGGDRIGKRPIGIHIHALRSLGAVFSESNTGHLRLPDGEFRLERGKDYLWLDEASVTGTAVAICAAAASKSSVKVYQAASEPYIQQVIELLRKIGVPITLIPNNGLMIQGNSDVFGAEGDDIVHNIMPDFLDIGTIMGIVGMSGGEVRLPEADDYRWHLMFRKFRKLGLTFDRSGKQGGDINIIQRSHPVIDKGVQKISDQIWPGLSPDLLSIMIALATVSKGRVLFHQRMFESRLFFADKLDSMGAQIDFAGLPHRINVQGLNGMRLSAADLSSPDIRAGAAMLAAALAADGTSTIDHAYEIDRGYQNIVSRLRNLGADIKTI